MDKSVILSFDNNIETSNSVAHEDFDKYPNTNLLVAEGVAVFNEQMELLPLISDFLTNYRRNHSDQSVKTYANNLRYLVDYLTRYDDNHIGSKRDDCLLTVHADEIEKYFYYLKSDTDKYGKEKHPISAKTIKNRDATYGRFFDEFLCNPPAGYKLIREENPYENGSLSSSVKHTLIKPARFTDIEALLRVANHEREKCLVQFMFDSGVRRGEVEGTLQKTILQFSKQNRKSIIEDESTIKLSSQYIEMEIIGNKGRGRESKPRNTVVSKETLNRVQKYHSSIEYKKQKRKFFWAPPAFLNEDGNPYTARGVSKLIKRLSSRALKLGLIVTPITPHKIRHGFAAMVLNSDDLCNSQLDRLLLVQRCLGHKNLETTEEYTKIPVEVWGKFVDSDGVELKRYQLMKKLKDRTKTRKVSNKCKLINTEKS